MNIAKWVLAGAVAGFIGAALWAVVAKATGMQLGIIAWAIGGAVGLAVKSAAGDETDFMSGSVAALIAVASVVGGRYAMLRMVLSDIKTVEATPDPAEHWEPITATLAVEVAEEWEEKGLPVEWPETSGGQGGYSAADYPADVWDEALRRYHSMTSDERYEYADSIIVEIPVDSHEVALELLPQFSMLGVVFLGLAGATAFKFGGDFGG